MARPEGDRLKIYKDTLDYFSELLPPGARGEFMGAVRRLVDEYEKEIHASALAMSYAVRANEEVDKAKSAE